MKKVFYDSLGIMALCAIPCGFFLLHPGLGLIMGGALVFAGIVVTQPND